MLWFITARQLSRVRDGEWSTAWWRDEGRVATLRGNSRIRVMKPTRREPMMKPTTPPSPRSWNPTRLVRVVESYDTSMGTTKVKTDATFAYLKAMGNRQGPHLLACELVGTSLARWFGLSVADFAELRLTTSTCFELPRNVLTQPGPAFASRHVKGRTWGGSEAELKSLANPDDITRLVIFDTWTRNCDRYPPDLTTRKPNFANVYLADTRRPGRSLLYAIDHTHCFDCGRDLTVRLADIDKVRDERTYGLFPAFQPFLDTATQAWCLGMLRSLQRQDVESMVSTIPAEWEVSQEAKNALVSLIVGRAGFIADKIDKGWPLSPAG